MGWVMARQGWAVRVHRPLGKQRLGFKLSCLPDQLAPTVRKLKPTWMTVIQVALS